MKPFIWSCIAAIMMLASCQHSSKSFMEGTFVSHQSGEYSISKDTLIIRLLGRGDQYQVIRKSTFQTIRNGKLQPRQQKVREYIAQLDPTTKVLLIDAQGVRISFLPDKNSLLLSQRMYTKVIMD